MGHKYDDAAIDPLWKQAQEAARRRYRGYARCDRVNEPPRWFRTRALRKARRCRNERQMFLNMLRELRFLSLANDEDRCSHEGAEFAPIADTYELDRAVQKAIAEAFGALIQAMVDGRECFERYSGEHAALMECEQLHQDAIRKAATILHTAMGGRIPDEVP